jgi:hypothetical protein
MPGGGPAVAGHHDTVGGPDRDHGGGVGDLEAFGSTVTARTRERLRRDVAQEFDEGRSGIVINGSLMNRRAYTWSSPDSVEPPPARDAPHQATVFARLEMGGDDVVGHARSVDANTAGQRGRQ